MASVRAGDKAVLLVVDLQVGVVKDAWQAPRVVGNVVQAVRQARAQAVPVIWVQHSDDELVHGSPQWLWVPELVPAPDELRIHKHFNSAFEQTALEDGLAGLGASHVVLAGAASNWCIRATAHAALERGYDLTLLRDAHTTSDIELGGGSRISAADIVHELNIALRWMQYPGRSTGTASATQINFSSVAAARQAAATATSAA